MPSIFCINSLRVWRVFCIPFATSVAVVLVSSIVYSNPIADPIDASHASPTSLNLAASRLVDASKASEMEAELRSKGRFERIAVLHLFANTISSNRLPEIFNWAEDFEVGYIGRELQHVVLRKLSIQAPQLALELSSDVSQDHKREFIRIIFEEWSVIDIEAALEYMQHELSPAERSSALQGLIHARFDLSESKLREIGRNLGHEQLVADALSSTMSSIPKTNHDTAWYEFVGSHGGDATLMSDSQLGLLSQIAEAWLFQDGGKESLGDIFSTLSNDASRIIVIGKLVNEVVHVNPYQASEIAESVSELNPHIGVRVMDRVMKQWAHADGFRALEAATAMEDIVARYRNERTVVEEWAKTDPMSLLASRSRLPHHLQQHAHIEGLKGLATSHPEAAVEALAELQQKSLKHIVARVIALNFARRDLRLAMQWVDTSADTAVEEDRHTLRSVVLGEAVRIGEVQLAMDIALEQSDPTAVGGVIDEVADQHGSEYAIKLLEQVSEQSEREIEVTYFAIGHALVREGKSSQAISFVEELPMEYQTEYFLRIGSVWAETEPHDLFNKLEDLPSEDIRKSLATDLAATSAAVLTVEQREKLKTIVSPVFRQLLD